MKPPTGNRNVHHTAQPHIKAGALPAVHFPAVFTEPWLSVPDVNVLFFQLPQLLMENATIHSFAYSALPDNMILLSLTSCNCCFPATTYWTSIFPLCSLFSNLSPLRPLCSFSAKVLSSVPSLLRFWLWIACLLRILSPAGFSLCVFLTIL